MEVSVQLHAVFSLPSGEVSIEVGGSVDPTVGMRVSEIRKLFFTLACTLNLPDVAQPL
jgi:hypothetical protein